MTSKIFAFAFDFLRILSISEIEENQNSSLAHIQRNKKGRRRSLCFCFFPSSSLWKKAKETEKSRSKSFSFFSFGVVVCGFLSLRLLPFPKGFFASNSNCFEFLRFQKWKKGLLFRILSIFFDFRNGKKRTFVSNSFDFLRFQKSTEIETKKVCVVFNCPVLLKSLEREGWSGRGEKVWLFRYSFPVEWGKKTLLA